MFMSMPVIFCGNSRTNSTAHCTADNSALATTDFGADRCTYATANCTT
jgi:hypothetical protein